MGWLAYSARRHPRLSTLLLHPLLHLLDARLHFIVEGLDLAWSSIPFLSRSM